MKKIQRGFTLIELLVVIGIIALLAGIVITAINPARQFASARNADRASNVEAILNAVGERLADNEGVFSGSFADGSHQYTCPSLAVGTTYTIQSGSGADLSCLTPTYIPQSLPYDPSVSGAHWNSASDYDTGYTLSVSDDGRYTVAAPGAELGAAISLTR